MSGLSRVALMQAILNGDVKLAGQSNNTTKKAPTPTRAEQSMAWLNDLPGRQAAGQTGTYNGWNALADMLGAYWSLNGDGTAAKNAGFNGQLFGQTAKGFMPNLDWQGTAGTTQTAKPPVISPPTIPQTGANPFNFGGGTGAANPVGLGDGTPKLPIFNKTGKWF